MNNNFQSLKDSWRAKDLTNLVVFSYRWFDVERPPGTMNCTQVREKTTERFNIPSVPGPPSFFFHKSQIH